MQFELRRSLNVKSVCFRNSHETIFYFSRDNFSGTTIIHQIKVTMTCKLKGRVESVMVSSSPLENNSLRGF